MKFKYIKLVGYAGIKQGLKQNEIEIDFSKCKHKLCVIIGDNGSGKSTLKQAISMSPDKSDMYIYNMNAAKIGIVEDDGIEYQFTITSDAKCTGKDNMGNEIWEHTTPKAFLKKITSLGPTELNPTGSVTQYRLLLETEFGFDPCYETLMNLSTESKGIVKMNPGERIRYVNNIVSGVEVYNNMNRAFRKRSTILNSMINTITAKMDAIGDEENVKGTLMSINNRINNILINKDVLVKNIAEMESTIKLLDPDGSIQNLYTMSQVQLETVNKSINEFEEQVKYILSQGNFNASSLEECNSIREELTRENTLLESRIEQYEKSLLDVFAKREEESRAIELKNQRLMSLKSEMNFIDIENNILVLKKNIEEYEKFFSDIHIKNAIAITKDEYITGLNTLKDIKDHIDIVKSMVFHDVLIDAINSLKNNVSITYLRDNAESNLSTLQLKLQSMKDTLIGNLNKLETINILTKRPGNCSINDCPFISQAVNIINSDPDIENKTEQLSLDIQEMEKQVQNAQDSISRYNEILKTVQELNIILRSIETNKSIIGKLPIADIFMDKNNVLDRIERGDNFDEILNLYSYLNCANMFEMYKIDKDNLYKLEVDYTIYQSKNVIIEEIEKDINELTSKLNDIVSEIDQINTNTIQARSKLENNIYVLDSINTLISILQKLNTAKNDKDIITKKIDSISNNMSKINISINNRDNLAIQLSDMEAQLIPLYEDRDTLKYNIKMLEGYYAEYNEMKRKKTLIEELIKYTNPNEKNIMPIQKVFIMAYLNTTLELSNNILNMFFGGRINLMDYDLKDNQFSMPVYSTYSNMRMNDVSYCSRSESAMAELAISTALFKQSSCKCNVLKIDEIEEGLDTNNRMMFPAALNAIIELLEIEQCIMVSHTVENNLTNADVILLRFSSDMINPDEGNVIYRF